MCKCKKQFLFFGVLFLLFSPALVCGQMVSADRQAWSGYWWPVSSGGLATGNDYRGNPAPLEKYELLVDGFLTGRLTYPYRALYYDRDAPNWFGLCDAWSAASTREIEPALPSVHDNILFRVGDKKGLYTLAHAGDDKVIGEGSSPQEFHAWLTEIIGQQGDMFYADLDASTEVWSYPIYAYDMTYGPLVDNEQAVAVTIYYASDFVLQDFVGTSVRSEDYTYKLIYSEPGVVKYSEWTGSSIGNHPQHMTHVLSQHSGIDGLEMNILNMLGQGSDDEWESPGTTPLPPGSYQLISLDDDRYFLAGSPNDVMTLKIEKLPGGNASLDIAVQDSQGTVLDQIELSSAGESLEWTLSGSVDQRYKLVVTQTDYSEPGFYQVDFDRHSLSDEVLLPYVPGNSWWNGFAITNLGGSMVDNVSLTSLGFDGHCMQSHVGDVPLDAGAKILSVFSTLPSRDYERSDRQTLSVLALQGQVAVVNLFGGAENGLGGFFSADERLAPRIQLPLSSGTAAELTWGGLINRSTVEQDLVVAVYDASGSLLGTGLETLLPEEKIRLSSLSVTSKLRAGGWIDASILSGENALEGYQVWRSLTDSTKLEGFRGLVPASEQWLPHVENNGFWTTELSLINPQASALTLTLTLAGRAESQQITLAPFEKRQLQLAALFSSQLGACAVKISATAEFSGYVIYRSQGDLAYLPLLQLDQLSQKLALPHLSVVSDWWTGVAIFNPTGAPVTVTMTPVKTDGNSWPEQQQAFTLSAGDKQVFSVSQFWSAAVIEQFSHIEFATTGGEQIGGIFLFGRFGVNQVAGSILPKMP